MREVGWRRGLLAISAMGPIFLAFLFILLVPSKLARYLENEINTSCADCVFKIGKSALGFDGGWALHFQDLSFFEQHGAGSGYDVKVPFVTATVNLQSLFSKKIEIARLSLEAPAVVMIDAEGGNKRTGDLANLPLTVQKTEIQGGNYTYVRNVDGTHAVLHLSKVRARLSALGGEVEKTKEPFVVSSSFQIEGTGEVELDFTSIYRQEPVTKIETLVHIKNMELQKVNSFFKPNAGVNLHGVMLDGVGRTRLYGDSLSSTVTTTFKDLKIELEKTHERTSIESFFMNVGFAVDANRDNLSKPPADRTRRVEITKEGDERIISFILRGLKEAALKVARAD